MQIILNTTETSQAVVDYIREQLNLPEEATIVVYVNDDGTSSALVNEDNSEQPEREPQPSGETSTRQKKPRRTKAQIEADNLAEEAAKKAAQLAAAAGNGQDYTRTTSAEDVKPTESAPAEDAGDTNQNQEALVGEVNPDPIEPAEATVAVNADPQPGVESQVGQVATPASQDSAEETAVADAAAVKPAGVSLFANLRRPNNG